MGKLLDRAKASFCSHTGLPMPIVTREVLGRKLHVRYGTIREQPDYDDAWQLVLAYHSKIVFDIGANIGQAAVLMLLAPNLEEIVLIDPNPKALSIAADNLIRNRLSIKARFIPAFVGEMDNATIQFWTIGSGSAGSRYPGHAVTAAKAGSSMMVPTITLDALCDKCGVLPDLVKIDVEGSECDVLLGSKQCARRQETRFIVEMHSSTPIAENVARVLDWCEKVDYQAWYLADKALVQRPQQIQHRGRCHLLLQPSTWLFPKWLERVEESASLETALRASSDLEVV